jgi:cation:H+ antiporter
MTISAAIYFFAGVGLLVFGAEMLVRGASRLATAIRVSPLVVGLTVVAYGTSAPELMVSLRAALTGHGSLAIGNVIGSNIFNVLFILGISASITPLVVAQQLVRREVWLMIGASALTLVFGLDGAISRFEGILLAAGALAYTVWSIRQGRSQGPAAPQGPATHPSGIRTQLTRHWWWSAGVVVVGLGLLVVGSQWLLDGAQVLARALGISELVVGLTIVAAGTSLPEVATSVVASIRGERDLAVGNVVGSNIFNLLAILGLTAAVSSNGVPVTESVLAFDLPVMIATAVSCLPIFFTGYRIDRWEGFLLLAYYVAYTLYLVLDATHSAAVGFYRTAMAWFVVPLTVLTLLVITLRSLRRTGRRSQQDR